MKNKVIKTLFIIESFFITFMPISFIKAAETGQDEMKGNGNPIPETGCSYPWIGCGTFDSDFAIRITLVDKNGKRVANTKTIELINSDSNNMSYIGGTKNSSKKLTEDQIIKNRYRSNILKDIENHGETTFSNRKKLKIYNNSRDYSLKDIGTEEAMYIMFPGTTVVSGASAEQEIYAAKIFEDNFQEIPNEDPSLKYMRQKNSFVNYLKSGSAKTKSLEDQPRNVTLLDFILYTTGYADTTDSEDKWNLSEGTVYDKDYYLVVEPVHQLLFREDNNFRIIEGTAKQMAEFYSYNVGVPSTSGKDFSYWLLRRGTPFYNLACSAYTESTARNTFGKNGVENYCKSEDAYKSHFSPLYIGTETNGRNFQSLLSEISDTNNLYGVNILSIKDDITESVWCGFELNKCTDTETDNTMISFKLNNEECINVINSLNKKLNRDNRMSGCYDEIDGITTNNTTETLNGTTLNPYTFLNIPTLDVITTRKCKKSMENGLYTTNNADLNAQLKILGNTYKYINVSNSSSGKTTSKNVTKQTTTQIYRLDDTQKGVYGKNGMLGIDVNSLLVQNDSLLNKKIIKHADEYYSNYIYIKEQDTNRTYTISDNQIEIGTSIQELVGPESREIINNLPRMTEKEVQEKEEKSLNIISYNEAEGSNKKIYKFYLSINGNSMNCPFEPNVRTYPEIKNVKFRVISLDNPFPARDGTSRMPGKNWLTDMENNVYDYIQNNRGVTTNEVYNKEPLYTITLDTSTIIKIRGYNQTHSYGNINVSCDEQKGTRCTTPFLRNTNYIKNLEGTCANLKEDKGDFYSCADKTEASSGYKLEKFRK